MKGDAKPKLTCACGHHHGCKAAVEAVCGVAAVHRAVDLGGAVAGNSAGHGAVHGVALVHLSHQLMYGRTTQTTIIW